MPQKEIVVVGPNPAFQKTLTFETLTLDKVNRAVACREYTGGKGTNFCRATACFAKHPSSCHATLHTFVGGQTGDRVMELFKQEGIDVHPVRVTGETRTCTTCLDRTAGTMTELIEPSHAVKDEEANQMDEAVRTHLLNAAGLAVMGSLPDGSDPALYTRWTRIAAEVKRPVLIDAVKGVDDALKVPNAHIVFKVNMEELQKITGKSTRAEAFDFAFANWSVHTLAVTDGPGVAHLRTRDASVRYEFHIAPLEGVVSPLGAGDTNDAVFFALLLSDTPPAEAFRTALAAASANCLHEDAATFTLEEVERIVQSITIKELPLE